MKTRMKTARYMGLALAIAALASCNNDDEFAAAAWQDDPSAVRIEATVGGLSTRSNPLGTEDEQKTFNSGDKITVSTSDGQTAVEYTFDGSYWNPSTAGEYLKWPTDSENYSGSGLTFSARYPAGSGDFTVPTGQSTEALIASADFMTASKTYEAIPDDRTVSLELSRRMARVVVTIAGFNDQFSANAYVSAMTVKSLKSIPENAETTVSEYSDISPYTVAASAGSGKADTKYYALVAPNTATGYEFLSLTVTDGSNTYSLSVKNSVKLEAGKSYDFSLTVGKDKVSVGSVTVAEWGNSDTIDGGEAIAPKVGDFYYSDGTYSTTLDDTKTAIGIVFSTDNSRVDAATKEALEKKGTTFHGLVMALTNASDGCRWGDTNTDENSDGEDGAPFKTNMTLAKLEWENVGGYSETKYIIDTYGNSGTTLQDTYAAFYAAQQYGKSDDTRTYAAPEKSTGWFVPSMGQWWTIIENLGGYKIDDKYKINENYVSYEQFSGAATTVVANLNACLQKTGADTFALVTYFWSSSEYGDGRACYVSLGSGGSLSLGLER